MLIDIPLSEHLLIDREIFRQFEANRATKEANPGFAFPPIALMLDAHSRWDYAEYLSAGQKAAGIVARAARRHCMSNDPMSVVEWGCGPGRIIRHLPSLLGAQHRYFGSDYNRASVEWCSANIAGVQFVPNQLQPPLPFDDAAHDFTYCRSVFTHLGEETAHKWVLELRRVTRPGGAICFTTHGEDCLPKLTERERDDYLAGRYGVRALDHEGLRSFSAFHSPAYVTNRLVSGMDVLEHTPGIRTQDVWVVRN